MVEPIYASSCESLELVLVAGLNYCQANPSSKPLLHCEHTCKEKVT